MKWIVKFSDRSTGIYTLYPDMKFNVECALLEGVTVDEITDTEGNKYKIEYSVEITRDI